MRWYLPTWNGDIRAEAKGKETLLTIIKPTGDELMTLGRLEHQFRDNGWWKGDAALWLPVKDRRRSAAKRQEVVVKAPLEDVAPLMVADYKPGKQTLTAIVYRDGKVETVDGTEGETALAETAKRAAKGGEKGATVKRPTPCCPQCELGSVEPASEVLLDFLDDEEHASWAADRRIVVRGGMTGHRYLIAHRNSPTAVRVGRCCMDLDERTVLHFHDGTVPPEEEVLGTKLVLEHREPWLRNEATVLGASLREDGLRDPSRDPSRIFDNPFGDHMDGVADSLLTTSVGGFFAGIAASLDVEDPELLRVMQENVEGVLKLGAQVELSEDDREFLDVAKKLGRVTPDGLAELTLYWKQRAAGETPEEPLMF